MVQLSSVTSLRQCKQIESTRWESIEQRVVGSKYNKTFMSPSYSQNIWIITNVIIFEKFSHIIWYDSIWKKVMLPSICASWFDKQMTMTSVEGQCHVVYNIVHTKILQCHIAHEAKNYTRMKLRTIYGICTLKIIWNITTRIWWHAYLIHANRAGSSVLRALERTGYVDP